MQFQESAIGVINQVRQTQTHSSCSEDAEISGVVLFFILV